MEKKFHKYFDTIIAICPKKIMARNFGKNYSKNYGKGGGKSQRSLVMLMSTNIYKGEGAQKVQNLIYVENVWPLPLFQPVMNFQGN